LIDGTRAMTGNLDVGTNAITNITTATIKTSLIIEDPGGGTNTVTLQAPTLSGNYTLTFPVDDGVDGNVLSTDGSGVLSWERNDVGTGILSGGTLSINADDTKFDITDGTGVICNPITGAKTNVSWSGLTAQSTAYSGLLTYVSINSSGVAVFSDNEPTNADTRDNILLGAVVHTNSTNSRGCNICNSVCAHIQRTRHCPASIYQKILHVVIIRQTG